MVRRAYGCDCDGVSHREPLKDKVVFVDGARMQQDNLLGTRPVTCPWRVFSDPLVRDVMSAYPLYESGQLALLIGSDPPKRLIQGIAEYHSALRTIDHKTWEERRRADESKRKRGAVGRGR
jgi:hypothetical protein